MKLTIFIFSIFIYSNLTFASHHIVSGQKVVVGNGTANTYVVFNAENKPTSLGIALSSDALEGLPLFDQAFTLSLPEGVDLPPYNHVLVNWNFMGHEPIGIYDIPHFDFHFYGITETDRKLISCQGTDAAICMKQPESNNVPMYYAPTPAGVPEMGWHWIDTRSPEFHGQRFTSTFIYGYYNSQLIFLEPMITREFLLAKGKVNADLSIPAKYSLNGYYPKRFTINYQGCNKLYLITLKDLTIVE